MSLRTFAATLVIAVIGALATSANASPPTANESAVKITSTTVKGSAIPRYHLNTIVNAPIDRVWKAVTQCEKYKGLMPRVEASSKTKRGKRVLCTIRVDLPFPLSHLDSTTAVTTSTKGEQRTLTWTLVKGDYKAHQGQWTLTPMAGGSTQIQYSAWVVPDLAVSDAMIRNGQRRELKRMAQGLRKHVTTKRVASK